MTTLPGAIDEATILAKQEELAAAPRLAAELATFEAEEDVADAPDGPKLNNLAKAKRQLFESDAAAFHEKSRAAFIKFNERMPEVILPRPQADSDHLHIFGPDGDGSGGPLDYKFQWSHLGNPFLSSAGANFRNGTFSAYDYTTGGPASWTVAQVGIQLQPTLPSCKLSIRPYVRWSGHSHLKHRVFDASLGEQRWAFALGSTGIAVQSWNASGGGFFADGEHWVDHWSRHQANPSGILEYDGTDTASSGLQMEIYATSSRSYTIWATCRVCVVADPGFAVATYATSAINCTAPFFVVEESPL